MTETDQKRLEQQIDNYLLGKTAVFDGDVVEHLRVLNPAAPCDELEDITRNHMARKNGWGTLRRAFVGWEDDPVKENGDLQ